MVQHMSYDSQRRMQVRQEAQLAMEKVGEEYLLACKAVEDAEEHLKVQDTKENHDLFKALEDTKKQKLAEHLQCLRQLKNIDLLFNMLDPSSLD